MKEVKSLCKKELVPIPDVFDLVMKHLQTEHCQVRISSFQVGFSLLAENFVKNICLTQLESVQ